MRYYIDTIEKVSLFGPYGIGRVVLLYRCYHNNYCIMIYVLIDARLHVAAGIKNVFRFT